MISFPQVQNFGFAAAFQIGGNINSVGSMGQMLPTQFTPIQPQGFALNTFSAGPGMGANIFADQRFAGGGAFGNFANQARLASGMNQMPNMASLMQRGQQLFKGIQGLMQQFRTGFGAARPAMGGFPTMGARPAMGAPLAQQALPMARPRLPIMAGLPAPQNLAGQIGVAPAQINGAQGPAKGGKIGDFLGKITDILGKLPGMGKFTGILNKVKDVAGKAMGVIDSFKKGDIAGGIQGILDGVTGLFGSKGAGKGGLGGILGGILKGVNKAGGVKGIFDTVKGIFGKGKGGGKGLGGILKGILGGGKKGGGLLGGILGGGGKKGGILGGILKGVTKFL